MKKFDPEKYESYEDLPVEDKGAFKPINERGDFVKRTAIENVEEAHEMALRDYNLVNDLDTLIKQPSLEGAKSSLRAIKIDHYVPGIEKQLEILASKWDPYKRLSKGIQKLREQVRDCQEKVLKGEDIARAYEREISSYSEKIVNLEKSLVQADQLLNGEAPFLFEVYDRKLTGRSVSGLEPQGHNELPNHYHHNEYTEHQYKYQYTLNSKQVVPIMEREIESFESVYDAKETSRVDFNEPSEKAVLLGWRGLHIKKSESGTVCENGRVSPELEVAMRIHLVSERDVLERDLISARRMLKKRKEELATLLKI